MREKKKDRHRMAFDGWVQLTDGDENCLFILFISRAREHFFFIFFFWSSLRIRFAVAKAKRLQISTCHLVCAHTRIHIETIYFYTFRGCCCCCCWRLWLLRHSSSIIMMIIISSGGLTSTFDFVWRILSLFRQAATTTTAMTTQRSWQLPTKKKKNFTANNKWLLITLTRLWPRRRCNQRIWFFFSF